jgi:hypothetical protein
MPHDLEALTELERRYDGAPPEALRRAALLGPLVERLAAQGNMAFFAAMARAQVALLRRRRAAGTGDPALVEDLRLYRREWRRWRRRLRTLQASEVPSAGMCGGDRGEGREPPPDPSPASGGGSEGRPPTAPLNSPCTRRRRRTPPR